ncbi:MAG TPA: NUDIX hydrolase [Rhizobiales bacterium]|nr:NUDIX hydrolase [Hyphomicrobiales bacterium]
MTKAPKLAALAVLIHEGKVLLVKRKNEPDAGLWGYPGGHVDLGETALEAASRELFEETNVIAEPLNYLTNFDVIDKDPDGAIKHHFLLAAVLCQYKSGTPMAQDDVSDAQWIAFDDVLTSKLAMSKDVDTLLRIALEKT